MKRIIFLSAVAAVFVWASAVRAQEKKDPEKRDADAKKEVKARDSQPKKDADTRDVHVRKEVKAKDPARKDERVRPKADAQRRREAPRARKDGQADRRAAVKGRALADRREPVRSEIRPPMRPGIRRPMRPGVQPPMPAAVRQEIAERLLAHRVEMEKQQVQRLTQLLRRIQNVAREEKAEQTAGAIDRAIEMVTQEARKHVAAQNEAAGRWQSRLADMQQSRRAESRERVRHR
jgi:hypothetical protein